MIQASPLVKVTDSLRSLWRGLLRGWFVRRSPLRRFREMFFEASQVLVTSRASDSNGGDKHPDLSSGPPGQSSVPGRQDAGDKCVPCPCGINDFNRVSRDEFLAFANDIDQRAPRAIGNGHEFSHPCITSAAAASAALVLPVMALASSRLGQNTSISGMSFRRSDQGRSSK